LPDFGANQNWSEIFQLRRQKTVDECASGDYEEELVFTYPFKEVIYNFHILQDHNFAWCPVYKAGSSALIRTMIEIWNSTEVFDS